MLKKFQFGLLIVIMLLSMIGCSANSSTRKMTGKSKSWSDTKIHEEQFDKGDVVEFDITSKINGGTLLIRLLGDDREIINFETDAKLRKTYTFEEAEKCKIEVIGDIFDGYYEVKWSVNAR